MNQQYNFLIFVKSMQKPHLSKQKLVFHKIHFTIRKKVKYGQAVYVCGSTPEFGLWNPQRAFRLKWNEGHLWTGIILMTNQIPSNIEYKYVIANWDSPSRLCEWQLGQHNRKTALNPQKPLTICDDKWNLDHVFLLLLTAKTSQEQRFYVTGDVRELGEWQDRKPMKKTFNSIILSEIKNLQEFGPENISKDYDLWSYSFDLFRNKSQFLYYYIRKGEILESERKPGRIFQFQQQDKRYPNRRKVLHLRGDIVIIDEINLNEINVSKITSQIYVGSYLKSTLDLQKLKQNQITSVFSIQSQKDFKRNCISPHYLKVLCQENQIKYRKYSIEDMNNKDFVSKAEGGVRILADLLHSGETVYVHCSAGIYRSPQMIALYLAAFQHYKVEQAVSLLQQKHPYARPDCRVVEQALNMIQAKKTLNIRA